MEFISTENGLEIATVGLGWEDGREICARIDDSSLGNECRSFLRYAGEYIESGHPIKPGETLGYGYWITKLVEDDKKRLCFWEYRPYAGDYVPGISDTLRFWRDQYRVCEMASSLFCPPSAGQMVVISDGVFEGDDVQGVRYPSPGHMSGWWITTGRYDGNVSSLKTIHAYHLTRERPNLVQYLALAVGYRFYSDNGEVRFDPKVIDDGKV